MTDETADIDGAIAALAHALRSMEDRQKDAAERIAALRAERGRKLDDKVEELLPAISGAVLANLKRRIAGFVDGPVRHVFEERSGILDKVLHPDARKRDRLMLQTRLKRHLEKRGEVKDDDALIAAEVAKEDVLAERIAEAMQMLGMMQHARRATQPLPAAAVAGINAIAARGRVLTGRRPQASPPQRRSSASAAASPAPSPPSRDDDLLIWVLTDVPTSFRTVMLDTFAPHGGRFAGGGAQGAWSNDAPSQLDAPQQARETRSDAAGFAAGIVANRLTDEALAAQAAERFSDTRNPAPDSPVPPDDDSSRTAAQDQVQWPAESDPLVAETQTPSGGDGGVASTDNSPGSYS